MNRDAGKIRVLMVIKKFHRDYAGGGTERSGYRLASALAKKGVGVEIVGGRMKPGWKRREKAGDTENPIPVRRLAHPRIRFLGTLIYNILLFFKILRNRRGYSCIHIHFASFEMMTAVISRYLTGIPVICKIACSGGSGEIVKAGKRFFSPVFFYLFRRIDAAVALSEEIRSELTDAGLDRSKIRVIPNGIDPSSFFPLSASGKRDRKKQMGLDKYDQILVFTGRLTRQKGLDILFESLRRLNNYNYLLIIAGQGELEAELKKLAAELGIADKIRFSGPVSDVLSLYQAGDIFVLPSRQEGLSNSLLEAMSSGMKVVATGISGSSRVIEDGKSGLLVPPEDPGKLAGALKEAFRIDDSMGRKGRERIISGYSVNQIADRYRALYSELREN